MKNVNAIQLASRYQVAQTIAVLAATMLLPVLVHLLPNINGQLSGAVLLPVFLAPMFAAFMYKKHVAIFAGIFAPLLNFLILGRPAPEMVVLLGLEIVLFVLILSWLKNLNGIRYFAAPLAYLGASLFATLILSVPGNVASPLSVWISSTIVAIPGIVLMGIFNVAILRVRK